ncbi:hypothetical protein [Elizabethkingia ursingii]|uniref:Uncharacterized protein n=1 Tax=Elizabethkingia ursingii TaxID=1756150 RepID=A0AAJ3TPL2_9FLAO|nr:hypothetical protein [Elizabethkingia ursingii]AQX09837.1 hypothetical protein BBD34_14870 [Elizabethkingia ursingii]OPB75980.1 hypothetical protein BAY32_04240 [Elizabethkingia ursingii]OPB84647.1 hypothetical protein BB021_14920 [Elizabethkingia ursingii]
MKAKELRIGNYLHDRNGNLCKVIELREDGIYAPVIRGAITGLPNKPIELTEEWLLKLGGEKLPHFTVSNSIIIKTKRNQELSFGCIGTPNLMVFLQEIDPDNGNKITDLIPIHNWDYDKDMYVHQLQNLFFALTGEELTIKS